MHGNLMARTGRKRSVVAREDNGRAQREREFPPAQVKRLRDAAMRGLRDAEWGTELGRLNLAGKITDSMFAAGKKWAILASQYQAAIGAFPVRSASPALGRNGSPPDPDSPDGQRIAEREANGAERFFAADAILVQAGPGVRVIVRRVCEDNEMPCGIEELARLRTGLMHLVSHWDLTGGSKSGNVVINAR
jgi:hypothetical protein